MREVLESIVKTLSAGREALVCHVVETKGSTPQKAGSWMLIEPDGTQVGTLGGGCVEAEVRQKAIRRLGERGAELHTYVLDHDQAWADGLVCGGKMTILAEAFAGPAALEYFGTYLNVIAETAGYSEMVGLRPKEGRPVGARWLVDARGACRASLGAARDRVPISARPAQRRPSVEDGVAMLPTRPRVRLLIVGAGHVGQAVAELAARVDFDVWIADDRKQYANAERFPSAQRVLVGPFDDVLRSIDVNANTYILIVTRGHGHDQEVLGLTVDTPADYVGLIGSKRKIRMIFEALREQGISDESLARVTAPVGLDIGSESVPEIALSIVAQLVARRNLDTSASSV